MSEIIQWVIVAVLVAAAAVFLVQRLRPSKKGCCSGCAYAGSCASVGEDKTECPTPVRKSDQLDK